MEPISIVLLLLAAAGVWAVVELALMFRKLRGTIAGLDKTVEEVNRVIEDCQPIVQKLDATVDELQPIVADLDPVVVKAGELVDAATADLLEVNVMLRDVSNVTGSVSSASSAVSSVADAATDKVQKIFGLGRTEPAAPERTLETPSEDGPAAAGGPASEADAAQEPPANPGYYTYGAHGGSEDE